MTAMLELRTYHLRPGMLQPLLRRFEAHTLAIFERIGVEVLAFGYDELAGELHYTVAWDDEEQRERTYAAMAVDEEWLEVRAESERDGALIDHVDSRMLAVPPWAPPGRA